VAGVRGAVTLAGVLSLPELLPDGAPRRCAAMRAERKTLLALRASQQINDETLNKLMREVDLSETALTARKK
jgi:hypothetical protein